MRGARALVPFVALLLTALSSCITPATQVVIAIGTDVPASVPLTITATVRRSADGERIVRTWTRLSTSSEVRADGGVALPASFGVLPGDAGDGPVTVIVEGDADGVVIRRTVTFRFVARTTLRVPIFLTVRCTAVTTGCTGAPCTLQRLCDERSQTCGNEGVCVPQDLPMMEDGGIPTGFPDNPLPACGDFHESCCTVGPACRGTLSCVGGRCQLCTDPGEQCCDQQRFRSDDTPCGPAPDACHVSGTCSEGVCSARENAPNGTICAPTTDPCKVNGLCTDGVCSAPQNVPDDVVCGVAPDVCHTAPVCRAGVCTAPPTAADGTVCASTSDTCRSNGTCRAGVCSGLVDAPNGTVCASTMNPCRRNGACMSGVCGGLTNASDGTVCATAAATDPCHTTATCTAGVCSALRNAATGTVCGPAPDACHLARTCAAGICNPAANQPNGRLCGPAPGVCQNQGTCSNGVCGPLTSKPNGTGGYTGSSTLNRCCNGVPSSMTTLTNCGACGIRCNTTDGQRCMQLGSSQPGPGYYCAPCVANARCWSGCCSNFYGTPYSCSASDCSGGCITCPGGATCRAGSSDHPNYCGY